MQMENKIIEKITPKKQKNPQQNNSRWMSWELQAFLRGSGSPMENILLLQPA